MQEPDTKEYCQTFETLTFNIITVHLELNLVVPRNFPYPLQKLIQFEAQGFLK